MRTPEHENIQVPSSASTLVIAAFLHHFIEERFQKQGVKMAVLLMVIMLCFNGYLQQSVRKHDFWRHTISAEKESIIERNHEFLPNIWTREPLRDPCEEKTLSSVQDWHRVLAYCRYPVSKVCFGKMRNVSYRKRTEFSQLWWSETVTRRTSTSTWGLISTTITRITSWSPWKVSVLQRASKTVNTESYGLYADSEDSRVALEITKQEVATFKPDVLFIVPRWQCSFKTKVVNLHASDILRQSETESTLTMTCCVRWMKT